MIASQVAYLSVLLSGFLFLVFPGIIISSFLPGFKDLSRITVTVFLSLAFWICIAWYVSWVSLSLSLTSLALQTFFMLFFFINNGMRFWKTRTVMNLPAAWRKWQVHHIVLLISIISLFIPFFYTTLLPGCDTSMHGYITRLIMNQDGLPHSYRPILPLDYFGSYSAGFHVLTALFGGLDPAFLRVSINFSGILVFPLALLAMVFFYSVFFSEKTATYLSLLVFGINTTLQGSIGWGGNPTMLAFSFCLFSTGLLIRAIRDKNKSVLFLSSLSLAAIPLVQAIPAVAFFYLAIPGFLFIFFKFRENYRWLLRNTCILAVLVIMLLLPFLLHFKHESSPELTTMIKNWQREMMGNTYSHSLTANLFSTLDQVKYRVGDPLVILAGLSAGVLLFFRKYRELAGIGIFCLLIFILVFNYAYWFLPLSEVLYPERVVYFMIIVLSLFTGYFLEIIEKQAYSFRVYRRKISLYATVIIICLGLGILKTSTTYFSSLAESATIYPGNTLKAFDWINTNMKKEAVLEASYADAGMWIPALCNRPCLGAHIHFLHLTQHVVDSLQASKGPRYAFITKRDILHHKPILLISGKGKKVFSNEEVEIYKLEKALK